MLCIIIFTRESVKDGKLIIFFGLDNSEKTTARPLPKQPQTRPYVKSAL